MKSKAMFGVIVVFMALALLLGSFGCSSTSLTTTQAGPITPTPTQAPPIKIGLLNAISGSYSVYGIPMMNGEEFAIQMINDAGGIKSLGGAKLTYVTGDSASDPTTAGSEAERLISSANIVALVGPTAAAESAPVVPIVERAGIPDITALSTPSSFVGNTHIFCIALDQDTSGVVQAEFIDYLAKNYGAPTNTIGVITVAAYATQTAAAVTKLKGLGYTNILDTISFASGTTDLTSAVLKLKSSGATLVLYNGYAADGLAFEKARYAYDYNPWLVAFGVSVVDPSVWSGLGNEVAPKVLASGGVFGIGPNFYSDAFMTAPSTKAFINAYNATHTPLADPSQMVFGAQKVFILAEALQIAGSTDPQAITDALRKVDLKSPDPYLIVPGLFPEFSFAASGLPGTASLMAAQWSADGSTVQTVWPPSIATTKPRVP